MSGDIRMEPMRSLSFFVVTCFLLIPVQSEMNSNPNQKCTKMLICHPTNPSFFLYCTPNVGVIEMKCPMGLFFNSKISRCDYPENSDCALFVTSTDRTANIKAENCNTCLLPYCRCANASTPGSLETKDVPQIVLVTFDDGINEHNIEYYRKLDSKRLQNPNGVPIRFTFFVSGDYTNYQYVKELYELGHEIASHSKTHRYPIPWWMSASKKDLTDEMVGMRKLLAKNSKIPTYEIKGTRMPFLQLAGDDLYQVFTKNHFTWDSTMVSTRFQRPIWPFTLDFGVTYDECRIERCPNKSYAGFWEVPLVTWTDSDGNLFGMTDENNKPKTKDEMLRFFHKNFDAHYLTNRAPFGITLHAVWFKKNNFNFEVLQEFLQYLSEQKDVWIIPVSQMLDWVRNPKPISSLSEIPSWNKPIGK